MTAKYPKQATLFYQANSEMDANAKANTMTVALKLSVEEWAYLLDNLAYEFDCNENKMAESILDKLRDVIAPEFVGQPAAEYYTYSGQKL